MKKFVYLVIKQGGVPYVTLVEECPEGVVIDELTNTWTHRGGEAHEIGKYAIRATQRINHPVGVYDPTNFAHLQNLVSSGTRFDQMNDRSHDWDD